MGQRRVAGLEHLVYRLHEGTEAAIAGVLGAR
jgi:hypothetical protein